MIRRASIYGFLSFIHSFKLCESRTKKKSYAHKSAFHIFLRMNSFDWQQIVFCSLFFCINVIFFWHDDRRIPKQVNITRNHEKNLINQIESLEARKNLSKNVKACNVILLMPSVSKWQVFAFQIQATLRWKNAFKLQNFMRKISYRITWLLRSLNRF